MKKTDTSALKEVCNIHEPSSHTGDSLQVKPTCNSKRKSDDVISNEKVLKKVCGCTSKIVQSQGSDVIGKQRLPLPPEVLGMFVDKSPEINSPEDVSKHQGRIRTFPHERGNWATHVFIEYDLDTACEDLFQQLLANLPELIPITKLHISISKTVILRHHWIQPFVDSLRNKLQHIPRFFFTFESLKFYTNEEKTRTFFGLQISRGKQHLGEIVNIVDTCLLEFKLPTFYENPSFHISIGWCLGNKEQTLNAKLPKLQEALEAYYKNDNGHQTVIKINQIKCKTGNKIFIVPLLHSESK